MLPSTSQRLLGSGIKALPQLFRQRAPQRLTLSEKNRGQFRSVQGGAGNVRHFSKMYPQEIRVDQSQRYPVSVCCNLQGYSATDSPKTDLDVINLQAFLSLKVYRVSHSTFSFDSYQDKSILASLFFKGVGEICCNRMPILNQPC